MTNDTCKVDGCDYPVNGRGYCQAHYIRFRKGRPMDAPVRRWAKAHPPCLMDGCERYGTKRGYCRSHYTQQLKASKACAVAGCEFPISKRAYCSRHIRLVESGVDPSDLSIVVPTTVCTVYGCTKKPHGHGLCDAHRSRVSRGQDVSAPIAVRRRTGVPCDVGRCGLPAVGQGLCSMHYKRFIKDGDPGPARAFRRRRGDGYVTPDGYRRVTVGGRVIAEHRHVMEMHLGRELLPTEHVHHIDGQRSNNDISNLELWTKSHPAGQRAVDKLAWAREIVALYGDDFDQGRLL